MNFKRYIALNEAIPALLIKAVMTGMTAAGNILGFYDTFQRIHAFAQERSRTKALRYLYEILLKDLNFEPADLSDGEYRLISSKNAASITNDPWFTRNTQSLAAKGISGTSELAEFFVVHNFFESWYARVVISPFFLEPSGSRYCARIFVRAEAPGLKPLSSRYYFASIYCPARDGKPSAPARPDQAEMKRLVDSVKKEVSKLRK
jgi:hypothetical protein